MRKILAIDGGGVRGIIPLNILAEIEKRTGKSCAEMFSLISGTSTGGIIALGLSVSNPENPTKPKYTAQALLERYKADSPSIFPLDRFNRNSIVSFLSDEKYDASGIEGVFKGVYGEAKLSDTLTDIMVPTFDIENRAPYFFKIFHHQDQTLLEDARLWQVARSTTAAPTFFEPYKYTLQRQEGYKALIDGGVFANNPSMCAYSEAMRRYGSPENFLLVSLGSGNYPKPYPYEVMKDLMVYKWARPLIDIMMYGGISIVDYQMQQLMEPNSTYFRFQEQLDINLPDAVDDASDQHIGKLEALAKKIIDANTASLDTLCTLLCS